MDVTTFIPKITKFKLGILGTVIISYLCFLISHFLIWGFFSSRGLLIAFTGLDSPSAIDSIVWLNFFFVIGFINYIYFHFHEHLRKDYLKYWILNVIIIIASTASFLSAIFKVYLGWEPWFALDHVVIGFYVWLASVIVTMGVLVYLNQIFRKIHELKRLYNEANLTRLFKLDGCYRTRWQTVEFLSLAISSPIIWILLKVFPDLNLIREKF